MPRLRLKNRKLSRQSDQRRVLIRTLATQLIEHQAITTSRVRAKALVPYVERIVSSARRGDISARRFVRSRVDTVWATNHLVDTIAPQMKRQSGFLRITPAGSKVGDNTTLVQVSFVDPIDSSSKNKNKETSTTTVKAKQISIQGSKTRKATTTRSTENKKGSSK